MSDLASGPLTTTDLPALTDLLDAAEQVDHTGEHYSLADLQEEAANPAIELAADWFGVWDEASPGGALLVGAARLMPRAVDAESRVLFITGVTRPSHRGRGVGTTTLGAALDRCRALVASGPPRVEVRLQGLSSDATQEQLLADHGIRPARWSFVMRAQLADVPAPDPLPPGLTVRPYTAADAEALRSAHNQAFLDHPGFHPWTAEGWAHWVTDSIHFRPALSRLVVDADDRIVAYVQTDEFDAYFEATGRREAFVAKVGTLREYRGRGLASTLLRHCLAAYHAAGYDEACLDVDSANPTGANRVYERAGFVVETRWNNYELVITG